MSHSSQGSDRTVELEFAETIYTISNDGRVLNHSQHEGFIFIKKILIESLYSLPTIKGVRVIDFQSVND